MTCGATSQRQGHKTGLGCCSPLAEPQRHRWAQVQPHPTSQQHLQSPKPHLQCQQHLSHPLFSRSVCTFSSPLQQGREVPGTPSLASFQRAGGPVAKGRELLWMDGRILDANPSVLSLEGAHALLDSFCSICHVKPFPVHAHREEGAPRVLQPVMTGLGAPSRLAFKL